MISDHEDTNQYAPNEGTLYGFVNIQGDVVIVPQYIGAHHFSEGGTAAVQFPEGDWGFINTEGHVMERG